MKLIVGLGNPGKEYAATRHNVGFMVVEALARQVATGQWQMEKRLQVEIYESTTSSSKLVLAKPQTFMNNSGLAVAKIAKSYQLKANSLYVVHDDLDIKLGEYKIQFGKGPHIHNGINSVEQHLKTKDFWRVRIGIAGKYYGQVKVKGGSIAEEYVLKPFGQEEQKRIHQVIDQVTQELKNRFAQNHV